VPAILDSGAVGFIWQVPPANPATFNGPTFAATSNIDTLYANIQATDATYTENSLSFMTPPHPSDLSLLKSRGAKLLIYHGTSDPIFSSDDSVAFYQGLQASNGGDASNFARLYLIPGMNHCSGGPATDQFDILTPLVNWVEQGQTPDSVAASARGASNPGGANVDVPVAWSPTRTRPALFVPEGRSLQRQRQHRPREQFHLPVRSAERASPNTAPLHSGRRCRCGTWCRAPVSILR
jgi:feruloyl esterase